MRIFENPPLARFLQKTFIERTVQVGLRPVVEKVFLGKVEEGLGRLDHVRAKGFLSLFLWHPGYELQIRVRDH